MSPRLTSAIIANLVIRRAEGEGGFGAVLAKGDATSGAILLILNARGERAGTMERVLQPAGDYGWQFQPSQPTENKQQMDDMVGRHRRFDPDLWVIELDIPSPERFAAEMTALN